MLHSNVMNPAKLFRFVREHISTIIFLGGFFTDAFLLPDIANPITKYIGLSYLLAIACIILLREIIVSRNTASAFEQKLFSVLSFGVAFFSGSAISFVFVYAMRSAAFAVSWPLFVILILCMCANEFISKHNFRFTLDIAVFFIALVFYSLFNVPTLFNQVTGLSFMVALLLASIIAMMYIWVLQHTSETAEYEAPRGYALAIGVPMFIGMLYFLNVIPAVPLSLQDSGIYHNLTRTEGGAFLAKKEVKEGYLSSLRREVFHFGKGDSAVYFYSSVYAPTKLSAPLSHVWEYYDPNTSKWMESTKVSFSLAGGRDGGYRAYSQKENITEGLWRVTIKVDEKRIVGRKTFLIKKSEPEKTPIEVAL